MASVLSRLQIVLSADTANYSRQMRQAQTTAQQFGSIAKKSIKVAAAGIATGAAIATAAVGALASEQMAAAQEIEQLARISGATTAQFQKDAYAAEDYGISMEQLGDISKDTKEKIGEFVTTGGGAMQDFADAVGYSEQQAKAFAESMQGLSGIEVMQKMVNEMEAAGASTEQISFALEGMGSDATLLIPLLADGGAGFKEMGDQAQAAGAIMSADTIAAAQELNNTLLVMETQWTGVKNTIFEAVLPALSSAAEWFTSNQDQIKAFTDKAVELGGVLAGHLVTGFNVLKDAFIVAQPYLIAFKDSIVTVIDFVSDNKEVFIPLAAGIASAAGAFVAIGVAAEAFQKVKAAIAIIKGVAGAVTLLASPMGIAILAIGGLVAAGVYLYRNWDEVKAKADAIWDAIGGTIAGMVDIVTGKWDALKAATSAAWDGIKNKISGAVDSAKAAAIGKFNALKSSAIASFDALPEPVKSALGAIGNVVRTQINVVKTIFSTSFNAIKALVRGDIQGVKDAVSSGLSQLAGIARNMIGNMVGAIKSGGAGLAQAGRDIIQGLINGIKSKALEAVSAATNMGRNIYNGVRQYFDINSPAKRMIPVGGAIPEGTALGIRDKAQLAVTAVIGMAEDIYNGFVNKWGALKRKRALFGNDDALFAFDYDVGAGAYDGWSDAMITSYRAELEAFEQQKAQADAEAKQRAEQQEALQQIQRTNAANAKAFGQAQNSAANAFNGLDINGPQTELDRLRESYDKKMAIVDEFERLHTDKTAQAQQARLRIEEQFTKSARELEQTKYKNTLSVTTDLFGEMIGKSKTGYKILFNTQKAFDFFTSQSASFSAIAKAWASAPFPANLANVAMTTIKTGIIPKAIQAIKPQGFMSGGYTGNYSTSTPVGPAHGQEFVSNAETTRKYRPELEAMHKGTYERNQKPTVVNVYIDGVKTEAPVDSNGNAHINIQNEIRRQAFDKNSDMHQGMQTNYNLNRNLA